jgi:hypothetical protein
VKDRDYGVLSMECHSHPKALRVGRALGIHNNGKSSSDIFGILIKRNARGIKMKMSSR